MTTLAVTPTLSFRGVVVGLERVLATAKAYIRIDYIEQLEILEDNTLIAIGLTDTRERRLCKKTMDLVDDSGGSQAESFIEAPGLFAYCN